MSSVAPDSTVCPPCARSRSRAVRLMVEPVLVDWSELGVSGTPGIELGFDIDLDGVLIRGFIDAIVVRYLEDGTRELVVRDHKTGNNPGDDFQLGVYSVALAEQFGSMATGGDYWMGRSGKPTYPFD